MVHKARRLPRGGAHGGGAIHKTQKTGAGGPGRFRREWIESGLRQTQDDWLDVVLDELEDRSCRWSSSASAEDGATEEPGKQSDARL